MNLRAVACLITFLASRALAGEISLSIPVDCGLGEDQRCYIQSYMDRDPGKGFRDFTCGDLSYDGHKGTDFALRSHSEMDAAIAVIAAAPGTVKATRDGVQDRVFRQEHLDELRGQDCGNGVLVEHSDGWETQYCHLRFGSVRVQPGDHVNRGDVLGAVGMSGRASYPHLHLSVRRDGQPMDPFGSPPDCSQQTARGTLWSDPPLYQPGGLIAVGFAPELPSFEQVKAGTAHSATLARTSPALVLWGFVFGGRAGDVVQLQIRASNGARVFETEALLEKSQPQLFRAGGRRTQGADWFTSGTFHGSVKLLRDGQVISNMSVAVDVTE